MAVRAIGETCATTKPARLLTDTDTELTLALMIMGDISGGINQDNMLCAVDISAPVSAPSNFANSPNGDEEQVENEKHGHLSVQRIAVDHVLGRVHSREDGLDEHGRTHHESREDEDPDTRETVQDGDPEDGEEETESTVDEIEAEGVMGVESEFLVDGGCVWRAVV
jgi:hypothetical protein